MQYKKFNLYIDKNNKQRFQKHDISQDELKMIEHGFKVEKNEMKNPENKPYIILLKKVNDIRNGNPDIFSRTIYFELKDEIIASKKILYAFQVQLNGRSSESIQNLGYVTKENLEFIRNLVRPVTEKRKKGKK